MYATYQLKPDELNEQFLQLVRSQFKNKTVEIAVSDTPASAAPPLAPRQVGTLKGRIKISADFNAPLDDFAAYQA